MPYKLFRIQTQKKELLLVSSEIKVGQYEEKYAPLWKSLRWMECEKLIEEYFVTNIITKKYNKMFKKNKIENMF